MIKKADHVMVTQVHDEVVLLNLDDDLFYGLNPSATLMWTILQEVADLDAALARLREQYPDVEAATLRADLEAFLEDVLARRFAVRAD